VSLLTGLSAYYKFNNNGYDEVTAASGSFPTPGGSTPVGAPAQAYVTGKLAEGVQGQFALPGLGPTITSQWAASFWVKNPSQASLPLISGGYFGLLLNVATPSSSTGLIWEQASPGGQSRVCYFDAAVAARVSGNWFTAPNDYVHVVWNFDSGNGELWINGVLDATFTGLVNVGALNMVNAGFGGVAQQNGSLDELGIWGARVLTSGEVAQLYNAGNALSYPFPLVSVLSMPSIGSTASVMLPSIPASPPPIELPPETSLVAGTEAETGQSVIRKHLNAFLAGPNWSSLAAALGEADDYVWDLARSALNQLFKSTASGKYLDALAGNDGNKRPFGQTDQQFRELAIELATGRVTYNSICRILQSFYGQEALRAYADSGPGPFSLSSGNTVVFNFEDVQYVYVVDEGQYRFPSAATATEVAVAFEMFFQSKGLNAVAKVVIDPDTSQQIVRVMSPSLGLRSRLVMGGTAALGFDTAIHTTQNGTRTVVVTQVVPNELDVSVPATALTNRDVANASYLAGQDVIEIVDLYRKNGTVTVTTSSAHGLSANNMVEVSQYRQSAGRAWMEPATAGNLGGSFVHGLNSGANISGSATDISTRHPVKVVRSNGDIVLVGGNDDTVTETNRTYTIATSRAAVGGSTQASGAIRSDYTVTVNTASPYSFTRGAGSVLRNPFLDTIFVTGGETTVAVVATTAMLSTTGTWTSKASMLTTRSNHGQVTLNNGNVLVMGGIQNGGTKLASAELYAPEYDSWNFTGSMAKQRYGFSPVLLPSGDVLVAGGTDGTNSDRTCEIYRTSTGTWEYAPSMGVSRVFYAVVQLPTGEFMYMGGQGGTTDSAGPSPLDSVQIYDPVTNRWRRSNPLPVAMGAPWAARQGSVIYAGDDSQPTVYWCSTDDLQWKALPALARPRQWGVSNGQVVLLGGFQSGGTQVRYFDAIVGDSVQQNPREVNGMHKVLTAPTSNIFTFATQTETSPSAMYGQAGVQSASGSVYTSGWTGAAASRTSNVTTLTLTVEPDTVAIWVNSTDANFSSGLKTLTNVTATTVSYAETAANASGTVFAGLPLAIPESVRVSQVVDQDGVFVLDPVGFVVLDADTTTTSDLVQSSAYGVLEVASTASFPDSEGWVVLDFGLDTQSQPIKYLEKISGTELLLEEFVAPRHWNTGATVTLVDVVPAESIGPGLWATASTATQLAAFEAVDESVARDIQLNWTIQYPGTIGMGRNDEVWVWGADEVED
jgi:hypothetical protein